MWNSISELTTAKKEVEKKRDDKSYEYINEIIVVKFRFG